MVTETAPERKQPPVDQQPAPEDDGAQDPFADEADEYIQENNLKGEGDTGGRKPTGAPKKNEIEETALTSALAALDIFLPPDKFRPFLKALRQSYTKAFDTYKNFQGSWPEYLELLSEPIIMGRVIPAAVPTAEEGRAPLETIAADWLLEQERIEALERAQEKAAADAKTQRQNQQKRQTLREGQFKDAISSLAKRYPGNKNVIKALEPDAFAAWKAADAQAAKASAGLPNYPGAEFGPAGGRAEIAPSDFVNSQDWGQFASDQGWGAEWEQGLFQDAFDANIAEPLRKGATTPAAKLAVESQIAKLQSVAAPALQEQFKLAQTDTPGLDWNQFLASPTAQGLIGEATRAGQNRVTPQGQAQARNTYQQDVQDASELASKGFAPEEIAQLMGITPEEAAKYAGGALKMREFQVGRATSVLGPAAGAPAGEVRTGEFGETSVPQGLSVLSQYRALQNAPTGSLSNQQLMQVLQSGGLSSKAASEQLAAMTPEERAALVQTASAQLGERNAGLNAATGGEWGQKTQEQIIAESNAANARAASEAREAIRGRAQLTVKDFQGRLQNQPLAEQQQAGKILADKEFAPFLDQIVEDMGGQIEGFQAALVKQYGGQISGSKLPTGNRELMLRGFLNEILPAYQKFQETQKKNVEALQADVYSATSPQQQSQALARLATYQKKIAPPPPKNPYKGTDFIDSEVRWAAENDQPNPYPASKGLSEIYLQSFKGPATSPNYPAKLVAEQQANLLATNAAQAQANAARLADMGRTAGAQPPGRDLIGPPVQGTEAGRRQIPPPTAAGPVQVDAQGNAISSAGTGPIKGLGAGRDIIGPPTAEQLRATALPGLANVSPEARQRQQQMLSDPEFGPLVQDQAARFVRQNEGLGVVTVADYALGKIADLWGQYQQRKTKPPVLGDVAIPPIAPETKPPVLAAEKRFERKPPEVFDYQGP